MATFGNTTLDGASTQTIENVIAGGYFTVSENGVATSITARLNKTGIVPIVCKAAIYSKYGDYFADTDEVEINSEGTSNVQFDFAAPPNFSAGDYYLYVWGDNDVAGTLKLTCDDPGAGVMALYGNSYGPWPSPIDEPTLNTRLADIYCTYIPLTTGLEGNTFPPYVL